MLLSIADSRMQVAELGQASYMNLGLRPDFVPNGFKAHSNHRVKTLELSIPDIQVFKVQILAVSSAKSIYSMGHERANDPASAQRGVPPYTQ